jgi:hypothetical protein
VTLSAIAISVKTPHPLNAASAIFNHGSLFCQRFAQFFKKFIHIDFQMLAADYGLKSGITKQV